jgi:Trypsin-like peptidase domain
VAQTSGPAYKDLREAVKMIRADRAMLATLFDAALAARNDGGASGLPASFNLAVVLGEVAATAEGAMFDNTGTRDALALALRGAADAQFAHGLLVDLIQQGHTDSPDTSPELANRARSTLFKRLPGLLFTKQELRAELQRMTHSAAAHSRPAEMRATLDKAGARICRVIAQGPTGDADLGTGFLIGPSCVLTNWHVVEKLTYPMLTKAESLRVEFDFLQEKSSGPSSQKQFIAALDWLVARSEVGGLEPANAEASRKRNAADGAIEADWWMDDACRTGWCAMLGTTLDYAVIRLDGNPGARRAHFDLWTSAAASGAAMTAECMVIHHPNGIGQSVNTGVLRIELNHGSRLFHTASTQRGSSGAMLFELATSQPVGLHHLGLGPESKPGEPDSVVPQQVVNVAVSLAAIAADIERQGKRQTVSLASKLMLHSGCLTTGDPVFARKDLLTQLTAMKGGSRQLLWITVPPDRNGDLVDYGRSYTARIIETLFPEPANLHIHRKAADIPADAGMLVQQLAERLIGDAETPALKIPDRETSDEAYDKVLFDFFAGLVQRHRRSSLVWLTIDDLDVHDLPDTDARWFLDRLYKQIATIPKLRIVLIGLKVQLQSLPEPLLARNSIEIQTLGTLGQPLKDWLDERSAAFEPLGDKARNLIASLALNHIVDPDALRKLHDYTLDKIEPVLRRHFESGQ